MDRKTVEKDHPCDVTADPLWSSAGVGQETIEQGPWANLHWPERVQALTGRYLFQLLQLQPALGLHCLGIPIFRSNLGGNR